MINILKAYRPEKQEPDLIRQCLQGDRRAQSALYERYADRMMGVCLRYVRDPDSAQDVLIAAFMKVFSRLGQYSGNGSLEGWIRSVVVREALMHLRSQKRQGQAVELEKAHHLGTPGRAEADLEAEELLRIIDGLPEGYRLVFNLYVVEGYSHKEIAETLGISEGTSKSQLSKAKESLRNSLTQHEPLHQFLQSL